MSTFPSQSNTRNRVTGAPQHHSSTGPVPPLVERIPTVPRTPSPDQLDLSRSFSSPGYSTSSSTSARTLHRSSSPPTSVGSPEGPQVLLVDQQPEDFDDRENWGDPAFVQQKYAALHAEVETLAGRLEHSANPEHPSAHSTLPHSPTADMTAHFVEVCQEIRQDMLKTFREELREQINNSLTESIVPLSISIETIERNQNRLQSNISQLNGAVNRVGAEVSQVRSEVSQVRSEVTEVSSEVRKGAAEVHKYFAEVRGISARFEEVGKEMLRIRAFAQAQDIILEDYDRYILDIQQCLGFQIDDTGAAEMTVPSGPSLHVPAAHAIPVVESTSTSAALPASAPAILPASAPAILPASAPAILPASTPAALPASTPAALPASALPASTPATLPASTPATLPASTSATLSASIPASEPAPPPIGQYTASVQAPTTPETVHVDQRDSRASPTHAAGRNPNVDPERTAFFIMHSALRLWRSFKTRK